jgi:hypothetical protein
MRFIKRLLVVLIIIAIAVVAGLGYLGIIPGVSRLLGADKPRDLGVTYTEADFNALVSKNHVKRVVLESAPTVQSSFALQGSQTITNAFTDKELTARLAREEDWALNPFTDVQVKIAQDSVVEASGIVHVDRLRGYAEATGVPQDQIDAIAKGMTKYRIPQGSFPVYAKGTLSITDNKLDINLSGLTIGKIPIAETLYRGAKSSFESFVRERLTSGGYGSLSVKALSFANGKMTFSGTLPKVITTAKTILGGQ